MSRIGSRSHAHAAARPAQQPRADASRSASARPPAPTTLPPRVRNAPKNVVDTFKRLDRDHNRVLDWRDFEKNGSKAKNHRPQIPGKDSDGRITLDEFRDYARELGEKGRIVIPDSKQSSGSSGGGKADREHRIDGGRVFEVRKSRASGPATPPGALNLNTPQGVTFRTDPSGLVVGRLSEGDRFVATHKKGEWYYGYVNGDPQKKGWILPPKGDALQKKDATVRERQLIRNPPEREPKHMVRDNRIARGPDGRNQDGFVTSGEKRHNAVVRDLESRFEVDQKTERLGYTQALPLRRAAPLMKDLDGNPLLNTEGKPITLPEGFKVGLRYTPDGEHAVVRLDRPGKESGLWGLIKLDDINWNGVDRSKVPGMTTPGRKIG